MRRFLATAITFTLIAPVFTTECGLLQSAFAHGGSYRGPAGEVPPDSRHPTDPPPPTDPEPPTTPPDDSDTPTTGDDPPGTPPTGDDDDKDGPGTGTTPPPAGDPPPTPGTGGFGRKGRSKGPGYEDWTFWWNYNKDDIVQLKSAVRKLQSGTRSSGVVHEFGRKVQGGEHVLTATDAAIRNEIMPALRRLVAEDGLNFDIQSAAAIGLAKIGDEDVVEALKGMARNQRPGKTNGNYHKVVRESAGLSFGLLQKDTEDVRSFLIGIVQDDGLSRSFVRPFSAISLGLLGSKRDRDGASAAALLRVIETKQKSEDLKPSALVALGLLGDVNVVPDLLHMVAKGKAPAKGATELTDVERAFAVQALGKIGAAGLPAAADKPENATAVVDALRDVLKAKKSRKFDRKVRYSAVIALGRLAPVCDAETQIEIVDQLRQIVVKGKGSDASEKNFAMISIGRIGAAEGIDATTRLKAVKILKIQLDKARPKTVAQPYAGLALGLIGRTLRMKGLPTMAEDINEPLRAKFAEMRDARARGAFAIASGLVGDQLAVKELVKTLDDHKADDRLRGYCAVSLGLIGSPESRLAIRKALTSESNRDLRVQTAVAAGLIGDAGVIEPLVTILRSNEESQYILGSVALALGQIGDVRSIKSLVGIAENTENRFPNLTRALATVALGQIGDRRDVPVLSRVSNDFNYRSFVPALRELLSIL